MTEGPRRLLVVDDEEVIREACQRILTRAGYTVETAVDGQKAVESLRRTDFDLVLLDIKMPVMDGMQVMDVLRKEQPDVKIVVITGHGTVHTAVQAHRAGAANFLAKPFSPSELRQAVRFALDPQTPHGPGKGD